jgi:hypothetical protein
LRRENATDSLQNDGVPICDDNCDAAHAFSAYFKKPRRQQLNPAKRQFLQRRAGRIYHDAILLCKERRIASSVAKQYLVVDSL